MNKLGSIPVGGNNPTRVMGILNISPESFYKRSIKIKKKEIIDAVTLMEQNGADFIDVGGASTAPYTFTSTTKQTEASRISNAIKIIQNISNIPISVDTCVSYVAKQALELGVDIINDISGLKYDKNMLSIIDKYDPSLVLTAFSKNIVTGNQLIQTKRLLKQSIALAKSINISPKKIVVDPGIGFFREHGKGKFFTKTDCNWVERDLLILKNLNSLKLSQPLLVSVSNKSFIGQILKKDIYSRLFGSLAAETLSVVHGADIIRTHNVSETKDIITISNSLNINNKNL